MYIDSYSGSNQSHLAWALLICLALAGCGGEREIPRFDLSGTVNYDGQPVPAGAIEFLPDVASGNEGPGTSAEIQNGRYATLPDRGTIGGPHVVVLRGYTTLPTTPGASVSPSPPATTNPLFTSTITVDLPKKVGEHDFDIPK